MIRRPIATALAAALLLSTAACGDDDTSSSPDASSTGVEDAPERIVSMSASSTEMLFAIGAGEQVVAADQQSNFPPEAPTTDLSAYEPNLEAIATYEPDLVIVSSDELEEGLVALGIDVYVAPAAEELEDVYEQLEELGELTGHADEAAGVVEDIQDDLAELVEEVPERDEPLTYFHELDDMLYSVTSDTFIGALYELAGLENVADAADADGQSGGYPQLSAEFLIEADPDLIFLADTKCCAQDAATVGARPGFAVLSAVTNGRVIALDDDVASRWGPRIVDLFRLIVESVKAVPAT
ncbi:MAG: ABC transporter substrate-binding protein [Actinomycetota bacterium]|nr:ABC transporter substrate-binding protein [Actinomycetota bacterium]